jgi:6,7-dimethyl-8-ribityllumazine synthase
MRSLEVRPDAAGRRFGIVVARFNAAVTDRLLAGAIEALKRHGATEEAIEVITVPGAFEIPLAALALARRGEVAGVVCLGAVIRGETPHFDYVAGEAARGISRAMMETGVPMGFGVLTTDTVDQALARAGGAVGNKGYESAVTVLEMSALLSALRGASPSEAA